MGDALLALDAQIAQLALRGLSLSIDDFGTGYSSLSYLQRLPVHKLKIDQSFVADIKEGHESSPVTEAIIALAAKLHLKVVAEGVETAQQWTYLRAVGCDEAQGFFVARPMPIEAVQDWYQRRTRKLIQVAG